MTRFFSVTRASNSFARKRTTTPAFTNHRTSSSALTAASRFSSVTAESKSSSLRQATGSATQQELDLEL